MVQGPHRWIDFGERWGWAHRLLKRLLISCNLYRMHRTNIINNLYAYNGNKKFKMTPQSAWFVEQRGRSHICDQDGSLFPRL